MSECPYCEDSNAFIGIHTHPDDPDYIVCRKCGGPVISLCGRLIRGDWLWFALESESRGVLQNAMKLYGWSDPEISLGDLDIVYDREDPDTEAVLDAIIPSDADHVRAQSDLVNTAMEAVRKTHDLTGAPVAAIGYEAAELLMLAAMSALTAGGDTSLMDLKFDSIHDGIDVYHVKLPEAADA